MNEKGNFEQVEKEKLYIRVYAHLKTTEPSRIESSVFESHLLHMRQLYK